MIVCQVWGAEYPWDVRVEFPAFFNPAGSA